ncbi:hypothetical protein [Nitrosophilus alvini]|uniref:hypothetical protein n=1 Tax=Nitrosophilus alvini TaxID=2714855 RepID=UPI00190D8FFB|nr:hypothetical protein [Nitrosophilus alvini]
MRLPLIITYEQRDPVNLTRVESITLKGDTILFHFTQRSIEWFFESKDEAEAIYKIILESYVKSIEYE